MIHISTTPLEISQDMLQQDKNKGGLNVTLLKDQAIGMKLAWVTRLTTNSNQSWKRLVSDYLPLKTINFVFVISTDMTVQLYFHTTKTSHISEKMNSVSGRP